jgi:hypothetical protein
VEIEIDVSVLIVRFGYHTKSVLKVLDVGAFFQSFHPVPSSARTKMGEPARGGLAFCH